MNTAQKKLQDFIDELKRMAEVYDEVQFNDIKVDTGGRPLIKYKCVTPS